MFSTVGRGPCRLEVLAAEADPLDDDASTALFVADNVEFRWGTHPTHPEPFAILVCQQARPFIDSLKMFAGQSVQLRITPMAEVKIKQPDPWNEGWTLGWGVYRLKPWDFRGLYDTEEKANAAAEALGADYKVAFGSNEDGTDNFITSGFE